MNLKEKTKPFSSENDRLVGIKEAAEILGVAPGTLRNWHVLEKGPRPIKISNRLKWRLSALHRYIQMCEASVA
jgi:predicted DNA-binding transcriptional regulator AlpA